MIDDIENKTRELAAASMNLANKDADPDIQTVATLCYEILQHLKYDGIVRKGSLVDKRHAQ